MSLRATWVREQEQEYMSESDRMMAEIETVFSETDGTQNHLALACRFIE